MADEAPYASGGGELNKRKYEDSPSPVARKATGFSSRPDSDTPSPAYNGPTPPLNEIERAKQKAQEIAARLLNSSDPLKRARVDSEHDVGGGFDYNETGNGQKYSGLGLSTPPQGSSYSYLGPSKRIEIPNGRVGVIIGKGGETIRYLQLQSGAKIQVTRDMDADPSSGTRGVELTGTPDQIAKAEHLISDVLSEAESGGSGTVSRWLTGQSSGAERFVMMVPNNKVGLVIGKGGETIKSMQARTGAHILVIPLHLPPGDLSKERTVQIEGTTEQVEAAKLLVNEVTSEGEDWLLQDPILQPTSTNRMRNSSSSEGYPQQTYQSRPPSNWPQSGPPMQQPGYGYTQSAAYPVPQYNVNQPPYSGYPHQPASGGYGTAWDQSNTQNPQTAQGGNYSSYSHQPQSQQASGGPVAPADGSWYGYGQATSYGQGQSYGQEGYDGYHAGGTAQSGYVQHQSNSGAGYDQQQQGYISSYGNVSNAALDGQAPPSYGTQVENNLAPAPGHAYGASSQPNPTSNYPPQSSSQPSYGVPPSSQGGYGSYGPPQAQKSSNQPTYAQPQQSPSAQAAAYTQPDYPHTHATPAQPGYGPTDSGAQRPPLSSYPASQQGYGTAPLYGASPTTQPSYGQQQPPPYTAYGGYPQPQVYSSDGSAAAPPESTQPTGAAKASPSST